MSKTIKTEVTKTLQFTGDLTKTDLLNFVEEIPETAKFRVQQPTSYPGEQGLTPGRIEATWAE